MSDIANVTARELSKILSAADFDLIDFVPSSLSAEENQKALDITTEYSELYMKSMGDFFDLYKEKKATQQQIAITEKKVTPGCLTNILIIFISYFLGVFSASLIGTIPLLGLFFVAPKFMENEQNVPFVVIPLVILSIALWIFFCIKLRKWIINKKELAKLDDLKQKFNSIQTQLKETIKNLDYPLEANEDNVCDDICTIIENYSKVTELLDKRDIIHKDTSLSPSACLLAIEQLYNVLRQEKHNKAMERATYNAAERIAGEVARQEETNRMVGAFLAGLMNGRNN